MSTVAEVKAALAALLATVSGVQRAQAYAPRNITAADLPMALAFTGPAQYGSVGADTDIDVPARTYVVRIYVTPTAAGVSGEAEQAVEPFLSSVPAAIAAKPTLNRVVLRARVVSDTGCIVLRYQDQEYLGVEFRIEVTDVV